MSGLFGGVSGETHSAFGSIVIFVWIEMTCIIFEKLLCMESKKMKSESAVPGEQKKTEFALGKTNIILIAVAFVVIVVGFLLMLGPGTTPEAYNPDIFSFRRIVLAPGIAFAGFVFMVYAIMRNSK